MAQAPATPKLRRWMIGLLAPLGLAKLLPLAPAEQAAITLRTARNILKKKEQVTFLIPLVGAHHVSDWQAVCTRLQGTLDSLQAQTNPNWRAVICCQDMPALPDDPRIQALPFQDPMTGNDKWRKLSALYTWLENNSDRFGYVMSFDADDLLHDEAVAEMLERQEPGYLVQSGYVMDHALSDYALAKPQSVAQPGQKAFWKLCGSCCALPHDPDMPESSDFMQKMTQHEHRMFPYLASLSGTRLADFSQPSVLYILNHGENFGARRGRVSFKTRFVQRFKLTLPEALAAIDEHFPKH